jgi:hypothetical protein
VARFAGNVAQACTRDHHKRTTMYRAACGLNTPASAFFEIHEQVIGAMYMVEFVLCQSNSQLVTRIQFKRGALNLLTGNFAGNE